MIRNHDAGPKYQMGIVVHSELATRNVAFREQRTVVQMGNNKARYMGISCSWQAVGREVTNMTNGWVDLQTVQVIMLLSCNLKWCMECCNISILWCIT